MLSTETRLRPENIANRIANREEVSFEEMSFIQKWASHNRSAYEILERSRRRAITGNPKPGSMDELIDGMNLGLSDPESHLIGPQDQEGAIAGVSTYGGEVGGKL